MQIYILNQLIIRLFAFSSWTEAKGSPRNENFNLLVRIKFFNLFLYNLKKKWKIYWS